MPRNNSESRKEHRRSSAALRQEKYSGLSLEHKLAQTNIGSKERNKLVAIRDDYVPEQ